MTNDDLPLYRIVDWNETFENAKSRECRQPSHVYKPNKMGIGLMNILVERDGRNIYGTWVLILDLVSRQKKPRNGYLTADGRPEGRRYRVAELAYLFRATEQEIRRCLEVVTSREVAWMVIENGCPEGIRGADTSGSEGIRVPDTSVSVPGSEGIRGPDIYPELSGLHDTDTSGSESIRVPDTSGSESIPIKNRKKEQKEPPSVPQGGTGENGFTDNSIPDLRAWISKLFGRERAWSYEELQLLTEIAPVEKKDRALLSWAYTLPRDNEGWALIDGKRASKPKQNLIGLLREFSSEIDKWRHVKSSGGDEETQPRMLTIPEWTDERMRVFRELFPDTPISCRFDLLAEDLQRQIDDVVREQKAA